MQRYAVVQETLETIQPEVLREILTKEAGLNRVDANQIARKGQGVLSERLSFQQASQVCNTLRKENYAVRALPVEQLVPIRKAKHVRWLELDDDGLHLPLGYAGNTSQIAWTSVFVISAGQVSRLDEQTTGGDAAPTTRAGVGVTMMPTQRRVEKRSERVHVAEIIAVADSGSFEHVRLPAKEMNYDRVLGPRPDLSVFEKYVAMLHELVRRSTTALVSPETRELLRDPRERYSSSAGGLDHEREERAFAEYNRWLLQMVIFQEASQGEVT